MPRLIVYVEGATEESFVNEVLGRHLYAIGFHAVSARHIGGPSALSASEPLAFFKSCQPETRRFGRAGEPLILKTAVTL